MTSNKDRRRPAMPLVEIVVIDDSPSDLILGGTVIESAGVAQRVRSFDSAIDALAYLRQPAGRQVELILLDLEMPHLNGFEFLEQFERLRVSDRLRAVVVMLTASSDPGERDRAYGFSCVKHYLQKPLTLAEARALVSLVEQTRRASCDFCAG